MEILRSEKSYFYSDNPKYSERNTNLPGLEVDGKYISTEFYMEIQYYIYIENDYYYISDDIRVLREISKSGFSGNGIIQLAIFKANFYPFSIFENIVPLPIASIITIENGNMKVSRLDFSIEFESMEQSFLRIHDILSDYSDIAGKRPYMMYSGGIDSSICMQYLGEKSVISGSSIFSEEQLEDVESGLKFLNYYKKNYEFQKNNELIDTIKNYNFYSPFIDLGVYDDLIHVKRAFEFKSTSCVNGLGPDEIMGVAFCRESSDMGDFDYFLNKYSMLKKEVLFEMFEKDRVRYVFEQSMKSHDFDDIYGKIIFLMEYHQTPVQHALTRNNGKFYPDVKRIFPFANIDIFYVLYDIPENMIYNNGIEKYFLRLFAADFFPISLWAKKKRPFDLDYYKIIKEKRDEIDGFLESEMRKIPHFRNDICVNFNMEPMDRLNLFMFINCIKDFSGKVFRSSSPI